MNISLLVEIMPFSVPSRVHEVVNKDLCREIGIVPNITYPLSALDAATLDRLCDEFRHNVFLAAGKTITAKR